MKTITVELPGSDPIPAASIRLRGCVGAFRIPSNLCVEFAGDMEPIVRAYPGGTVFDTEGNRMSVSEARQLAAALLAAADAAEQPAAADL